ncbi:hypothetical protein ACS04_21315 [Streptomyces roseus]|uniref:Uncharacterized protein n=1 Tax=Streptomyces roseus TaxID=66430 RepID=A0A0J6XM26_9ACTN|nr:hypothetical protein ACS04_21315 [Streptomyces roseus]
MPVSGLLPCAAAHRDQGVAATVRAAGASGARLDEPEQLAGAWRGAFRHEDPPFGKARADPCPLSIPTRISAEMVTGSALSADGTMLDGGVGSMIRMARSRLRHVLLT